MIDIHTHIIPKVDDGARSYEESLAMIEKMIGDGITTIIATPHVQSPATRAKRQQQIENFNILKDKASHLDVELILGAEVLYRSHIDTNYNELTLGDTKYVLIEFHWSIYNNVEEVVYNLYRSGFKPIVAHVERYPYLKRKDYKKIIDSGALLQVNSSSVIGNRGRKEQRITNYLLKRKLVTFVSSDAHQMGRRTPNLIEAYNYLKGKISDEYLEQLFKTNALRIIK